jgi:hypothetical protein
MKHHFSKNLERRILLRIALVVSSSASSAMAVTWDIQAQRLQLVSASFLDAQPLLSQTPSSEEKSQFRIEGKSIVTFLPKLNGTVGGKTEQPPQPPAHSIPTVEVDYQSKTTFMGSGIVRLWSGYLPGDAAKPMGMNASCEQSLTGISLGLKNQEMNFVTAVIEVGQQWNQTKVQGGITEPDAKDLFRVQTGLRFGTLTVTPKKFPKIWTQAQVGERDVMTYFEIPSDGTTFKLRDRGTMRRGNAAAQFSVGYNMGNGFQWAVAYLNVPQRSTVPRFLLSYSAATSGRTELLASHPEE